MAILRLNPLSSKEIEVSHCKESNLRDILDEVLKDVPKKYLDESLQDYFEILVDGEMVAKDEWETTIPQDSEVLIAITPHGDDGLLRQAIVLAAVITASVLTPAGWMRIAATSLAAIGGSLLANALVPLEDLGGIGSLDSDYSQKDSQTYTITGQSNSQEKYGSVPKVYGRHRFYPNIASNPYTELEVDSTTGELVQYFYGIYDFGLGPNLLEDIKIGETAFEEYSNAAYRLVDLNKPATDEGSWDTPLTSSFEYYKGDVYTENIQVPISKNQEDAGALPSEYELVRAADDSGAGDNQEAVVTLVCPSGLTTIGTNGDYAERSIELEVMYAEVGTENWLYYNDEINTNSWSTKGKVAKSVNNLDLAVFTKATTAKYYNYWDVLEEKSLTYQEWAAAGYRLPYDNRVELFTDPKEYSGSYFKIDYGIVKGATSFVSNSNLNPDTFLTHNGDRIGKVQTRTHLGSGIYQYTTYEPFSYSLNVFTSYILKQVDQPEYQEAKPLTASSAMQAEDYSAGRITFTDNTTNATYCSIKFTPKTLEPIKIRVRRLRSYGGYTYSVRDDLSWYTLLTRFDRNPIDVPTRHTFMEVKIQATDQLNGTIRNLSGVLTSVLDVYNGTTWEKAPTRNPAWVFADILTGEINKRPLSKDRIDLDSLLEWETLCNEVPAGPAPGGFAYEFPRFQCDFAVDYSAVLSKLLSQVSSMAQASLNLQNGLYGVLIDVKKTIPVQVFTPRNSSDFSSARTYADIPHGLKIRYIEGLTDWSVREEVVYYTGYDSSNATKFEEFDAFACTNREQALRFGRYMLFQAVLRQETVTINVDFENLVCTRGDYVLYQQDVMKVGGTPARVKTVVGNVITIDSSIETEVGKSYGYTFRNSGQIYTSTMTVTAPDTATLDGDLPNVGDLIVWGEVDKITINMIVKSIVPSSDLTAQITLVERANAIHDAENDVEIPEYDPQFSVDEDVAPPGPVQDLAAVETIDCAGGDYVYQLQITWNSPEASAVEVYEVYVDKGAGYVLSGYTNDVQYSHTVDVNSLGIEHSVKVIAVSTTGNKLTLADVPSVSLTPISKSTPPSDVEAMYLNILNETLQIDWPIVTDCDLSYYLIRYSPTLTGTWFSSIPLVKVDAGTSLTHVQARTGTYLIKAVDWNGNESEAAAVAITSIPSLVNLNIITETNDFPSLLGTKTKVISLGGDLILQEKEAGEPGVVEYWEDGYYTYKNILDLGEIYTVRLQSLIEAEGYSSDDLMINWNTLTEVVALASSTVSDWDVETQFRSTDNYITMDTWAVLSDVATLTGGAEEVWTEWKKFTIGDFTARIFQFRLRLVSNKPSISPRVFDGVVKADMPDRVESYSNIAAPSGGYSLTYSPAFKGPGTTPSIQISMDDAQTGDYWKFSSKSLEGFSIRFFDRNDIAVSRQFDAQVKGYGRKTDNVIG